MQSAMFWGFRPLALAMAMVVAGGLSAPAQTIDVDDMSFTRITDEARGVEFLVPDEADLLRPPADEYRLYGLAADGRRELQVVWDRRVVWVDSFDIAFEFMHVDWLQGHAALTGQTVTELRTIETETGITAGQMEASVETDGSDARRSYLFMVGDTAYHIHGQNERSNALVDIVASRFAAEDPEPWDALDDEQTVRFLGIEFMVRSDLVVTDISNDEGPTLVISDREDLENAVVLLILRFREGSSYADQARIFFEQMVRLGFLVETEEVSDGHLTLELLTADGREFRAYMAGVDGGPSVGLLTPWVAEEPAIWLAARRAFAAATLALDDGITE